MKIIMISGKGSESGDETDGPIEFIQNIVNLLHKISMVLSKREKEKPFLIFLLKFLQHC